MACGIGPQPSLRDSRPFGVQPSVETLGYSRLSLLDSNSFVAGRGRRHCVETSLFVLWSILRTAQQIGLLAFHSSWRPAVHGLRLPTQDVVFVDTRVCRDGLADFSIRTKRPDHNRLVGLECVSSRGAVKAVEPLFCAAAGNVRDRSQFVESITAFVVGV